MLKKISANLYASKAIDQSQEMLAKGLEVISFTGSEWETLKKTALAGGTMPQKALILNPN